jgi:hypothetical protein
MRSRLFRVRDLVRRYNAMDTAPFFRAVAESRRGGDESADHVFADYLFDKSDPREEIVRRWASGDKVSPSDQNEYAVVPVRESFVGHFHPDGSLVAATVYKHLPTGSHAVELSWWKGHGDGERTSYAATFSPDEARSLVGRLPGKLGRVLTRIVDTGVPPRSPRQKLRRVGEVLRKYHAHGLDPFWEAVASGRGRGDEAPDHVLADYLFDSDNDPREEVVRRHHHPDNGLSMYLLRDRVRGETATADHPDGSRLAATAYPHPTDPKVVLRWWRPTSAASDPAFVGAFTADEARGVVARLPDGTREGLARVVDAAVPSGGHRKYEQYRSPSGGMVVRGKYYPGGKMVPDMTPPTKVSKRSKLREWFKVKQKYNRLVPDVQSFLRGVQEARSKADSDRPGPHDYALADFLGDHPDPREMIVRRHLELNGDAAADLRSQGYRYDPKLHAQRNGVLFEFDLPDGTAIAHGAFRHDDGKEPRVFVRWFTPSHRDGHLFGRSHYDAHFSVDEARELASRLPPEVAGDLQSTVDRAARPRLW